MSRASEKAAKDIQDQENIQDQTPDVVEADKASEKVAKTYTVKVKGNPTYCGVGAGGVQFANGQAIITSDRMAAWFREHAGYEVK